MSMFGVSNQLLSATLAIQECHLMQPLLQRLEKESLLCLLLAIRAGLSLSLSESYFLCVVK